MRAATANLADRVEDPGHAARADQRLAGDVLPEPNDLARDDKMPLLAAPFIFGLGPTRPIFHRQMRHGTEQRDDVVLAMIARGQDDQLSLRVEIPAILSAHAERPHRALLRQ